MASRSQELDNRLSILLELARQLPFDEVERLNLTAIEDPDQFKSEVLDLVTSKQVTLNRRVVRKLRRQRAADLPGEPAPA